MPGTQKVHTGAHTHTLDRGKHSVLWIPIEGLHLDRIAQELSRCQLFACLGSLGLERGRMARKRRQDCFGTQKVPNKSSFLSICRKFVTHRAHMPFVRSCLFQTESPGARDW